MPSVSVLEGSACSGERYRYHYALDKNQAIAKTAGRRRRRPCSTMDPLAVVAAAWGFIATGQSIYRKVEHATHASVSVTRLSSELRRFGHELDGYKRHLSRLPSEQYLDRDCMQELISEAQKDIRTLDSKLRGATRQAESGIEVRLLSWLCVEDSCQQIELNLTKTLERLGRLRISLLTDIMLSRSSLDQPRVLALSDRVQQTDFEYVPCTSVIHETPLLERRADADPEKLASSGFNDASESLASTQTVLRTSSTITAMPMIKPFSFRWPSDCNCRNFRCRACRKRSRSIYSVLAGLSFQTCFGYEQFRAPSPDYSLALRGTLAENSDANRYARTGNIEGLKRLIQDRVVNISMTADDGWTLLHNAAYYGQLGVVNFLLGQGCRVDCPEDGGRKPADLARMRALRVGATVTEQEIALRFPDVESFKYDHELTPVHIAVLGLHTCRDKSHLSLSDLLDFIDEVENSSHQKPGLTATGWSRKEVKSLRQIIGFYERLGSDMETGKSKQRIINVADAMHGWTPFLWATVTGRLDAMRLLLHNDADPFIVSEKGRNAVHLAAESRSPEVMFYVLSIPEVNGERLDVNLGDFWKETPLHIAASVSAETTRLLLANGADRTAKQATGQIPLHYASLYRTAKEANERVALGCSTVEAGEREKAAIVDQLSVGIGSYIDSQDEEGRTPIFDLLDSAACVKILVDRGASTSIQDNAGNSPIHQAAIDDNLESLKVLIRSNQDVLADVVSRDGYTPIALAVMNRSSACAQFLLKHHGSVHCSSKDGWSLVHHAAAWGNANVLEAVLEHRSFRQGARTLNHESAADIAKSAGHWTGKVKELLKQHDSIGQMAMNAALCVRPLQMLQVVEQSPREHKEISCIA